jgi:hypothetical protein
VKVPELLKVWIVLPPLVVIVPPVAVIALVKYLTMTIPDPPWPGK